MQITPYTDINALLDSLLSQMHAILHQKLVGVYVYGSLVLGDFDHESSDIDIMAATAADIDDKEFSDLQRMHHDFVDKHTQWTDRIEIAYISVAALQTFKSHTSKIAIISPGEPFHIKEAGEDWLINWYMVQEKGRTLFGPPPTALIDSISKEEFIHAVHEQTQRWRTHIQDMRTRPAQAYAILTMCRALYTVNNGEQVSKKQAALWAEKKLPEWSYLIKNALVWRAAWRETNIDHNATFPETQRFVQYIIALVAAS